MHQCREHRAASLQHQTGAGALLSTGQMAPRDCMPAAQLAAQDMKLWACQARTPPAPLPHGSWQGRGSCGSRGSHAPGHGIGSVVEGHDEGVPLSGDLVATISGQVGTDDLIMQGYGL